MGLAQLQRILKYNAKGKRYVHLSHVIFGEALWQKYAVHI